MRGYTVARGMYLPGEREAADGHVAQPQGDGEEGQQVPVVFGAGRGIRRRRRDSLHGDLDELAEGVDPSGRRGQQHLRGGPALDLVEPPQQQVEVGRHPAGELLPAHHLHYQLDLVAGLEQLRVEDAELLGQLAARDVLQHRRVHRLQRPVLVVHRPETVHLVDEDHVQLAVYRETRRDGDVRRREDRLL